MTVEQLRGLVGQCTTDACETYVKKQIEHAKAGGEVSLTEVSRQIGRLNQHQDDTDKVLKGIAEKLEKGSGAGTEVSTKLDAAFKKLDDRDGKAEATTKATVEVLGQIKARQDRSERLFADAQHQMEQRHKGSITSCPNCQWGKEEAFELDVGRCPGCKDERPPAKFSTRDKENKYEFCPGCGDKIIWKVKKPKKAGAEDEEK